MQVYKHLQIILVEDSISDAKLTQYVLSGLSPSPILLHFESGDALFDYLENSDINLFSLILLDMNLPRMSGLEILAALRKKKEYQQIPVVMFSSSKEEKDVLNSYQGGANAYVQKPLTLEEFGQTVEAIVNFWTHANVLPSQISA